MVSSVVKVQRFLEGAAGLLGDLDRFLSEFMLGSEAIVPLRHQQHDSDNLLVRLGCVVDESSKGAPSQFGAQGAARQSHLGHEPLLFGTLVIQRRPIWTVTLSSKYNHICRAGSGLRPYFSSSSAKDTNSATVSDLSIWEDYSNPNGRPPCSHMTWRPVARVGPVGHTQNKVPMTGVPTILVLTPLL